LRRNPNLAWAIAGRAHVPTTIDAACFDLMITHDSATAVTNVVEAPRLIAEELPSESVLKLLSGQKVVIHSFQQVQKLVVINQERIESI